MLNARIQFLQFGENESHLNANAHTHSANSVFQFCKSQLKSRRHIFMHVLSRKCCVKIFVCMCWIFGEFVRRWNWKRTRHKQRNWSIDRKDVDGMRVRADFAQPTTFKMLFTQTYWFCTIAFIAAYSVIRSLSFSLHSTLFMACHSLCVSDFVFTASRIVLCVCLRFGIRIMCMYG